MDHKPRAVFFLIPALCILFILSFTSCGRRGDPIPLSPYKGEAIKKNADVPDKAPEEIQEIRVIVLDRPEGLSAVFAGGRTIVTWDEMTGKGVIHYKIYRSTGNDFGPVGDTDMPVFIDTDVKPGKKYYYRVSAVGTSEGPLSRIIEVVTEAR
ncbi:MAG: fibronectin type III domain-containing protein [Nitrospirota bacterium]|nr:fibronectin type III domain-containing protein [Nitrospirota bacterium]